MKFWFWTAVRFAIPFISLAIVYVLLVFGPLGMLATASGFIILGLVTDRELSRRNHPANEWAAAGYHVIPVDSLPRNVEQIPMFGGVAVALRRTAGPMLKSLCLDLLGVTIGLVALGSVIVMLAILAR